MRRLLLRLYPRRWRERYEDELVALLDETGIGPREAADLVRGGVAERGVELRRSMAQGGAQVVIGPAWRHPTVWALGGAALVSPTLLFVAMSYLAYQLGLSGLTGVMDPVNDALNRLRPLDLLLVAAPVAALLAAAAPLLRLELRRADAGNEVILRLRLRPLNLLVGAVALVVGGFLVMHIVVESVLRIGP